MGNFVRYILAALAVGMAWAWGIAQFEQPPRYEPVSVEQYANIIGHYVDPNGYTVLDPMDLSDVPSHANCKVIEESDPARLLKCVWRVEGETFDHASAYAGLQLPTKGLYQWDYSERDQAFVPAHLGALHNFFPFLGTGLFTLLALVLLPPSRGKQWCIDHFPLQYRD